jgi:hypothetical protein
MRRDEVIAKLKTAEPKLRELDVAAPLPVRLAWA